MILTLLPRPRLAACVAVSLEMRATSAASSKVSPPGDEKLEVSFSFSLSLSLSLSNQSVS